MVDNGSLVDMLFLLTLQEMEIDETKIEKSTTMLVGFNRKSTVAIGKIKLPAFVIS